LQAEEDRDQVRRHYADLAREKALLGHESSAYNSERYVFIFRLCCLLLLGREFEIGVGRRTKEGEVAILAIERKSNSKSAPLKTTITTTWQHIVSARSKKDKTKPHAMEINIWPSAALRRALSTSFSRPFSFLSTLAFPEYMLTIVITGSSDQPSA
jgi:hypothetical protein